MSHKGLLVPDRGFDLGKVQYQHEDGNDDPVEDLFAAADVGLTRTLGAYLQKWGYARHPFRIIVQHRQGIVQVHIPVLMGDTYEIIKIKDLETDPAFRLVYKACSRILERYLMSRVGYDSSEFAAALSRQPLFPRASGRSSGLYPD